MPKYAKLVLKIFVSAALLYLLYRFNTLDIQVFLNSFKLLNLAFVPLVFLFLVLNYFVSSVRWKSLLIHGNSEHVSVKYLTSLYFIGSFFNNFMPTSIGGDVYKIYRLGKKINNVTDAFTSTFMERFTGVIVLCFISAAALISLWGIWGVVSFILLGVGLIVGFFVLKVLANKIALLNKLYESLMAYKGQHRVIIWAIITSLIVQLLSVFTQYFIFMGLGQNIPLSYALFVFPLIALISFVPITFNGIGIQDSLYATFFIQAGVSAEIALTASVLYHLARLFISLVGGVLYATTKE